MKNIVKISLILLLSLAYINSQRTETVLQSWQSIQEGDTEFEGWVVENNIYQSIQKCNENDQVNWILGGNDAFGTDTTVKRIVQLKEKPQSCVAKFDLYLDNTAYEDTISFYVNGVEIYKFECKVVFVNNFDLYNSVRKLTCQGSPFDVFAVPITTNSFNPNSKLLVLEFAAVITNEDSYWGLRNFDLTCQYAQVVCPPNSTLQADQKTCACNNGFFLSNSLPITCTRIPTCHASCLQCSTNSDICILCPDNSTVSVDGKQCLCNNEYYLSSQFPFTCTRIPTCHTSCLQCTQNTDNCVQCPDNSSVSVDGKQCLCNNGFYVSSTQPFTCTRIPTCHASCLQCTQNTDNCVQCPDNSSVSVDGKQCLCNNGFYVSSTQPFTCTRIPTCHSSCLQCSQNTDNCVQCPANSSVSADGKQCLCNDGYFLSTAIPFQCELIPTCDSRCQQCQTNTNICIRCPPNSSVDSTRSRCVCNQGHFESSSSPLVCKLIPKCDESCSQCNPNTDDCVLCGSNAHVSPDGKTCLCNDLFIPFIQNPLSCIEDPGQKTCPDGSQKIDDECVCLDGSVPQYDENGQLTGCIIVDTTCSVNSVFSQTLLKCVCKDGFTASSQDPLVCSPNTNTDQKCHISCNCSTVEDNCSSSHKCVSCKQTEGTQMVNQDFCQCLTPQWRLKEGSEWECEKVTISTDVPKCEWQLFNQIVNMVVHSNCSFQKTDNQSLVVDQISYDWRRIDQVNLDEDCKLQLNTQVLWAKDCANYNSLPSKYVTQTNPNQVNLSIPLIDIYDLTSNTQLTDDGRTIYQVVCLAIELSHARRAIRQHRFQMRVYTNRDQVEVFHLTVTKQITEGCDKGQECIIVADLDTKGEICKDKTCTDFYAQNTVPTYKVGDHMYVRIQFVDNTYTKYLTIVNVKYVDDYGIYNYVKGTQWWTVQQQLGLVDLDVLLFQPHVNASVIVELKIALQKDTQLRSLEENGNSQYVEQIFKVNTRNVKANSAQSEQSSNFALNTLAFSIIAFALSLLI